MEKFQAPAGTIFEPWGDGTIRIVDPTRRVSSYVPISDLSAYAEDRYAAVEAIERDRCADICRRYRMDERFELDTARDAAARLARMIAGEEEEPRS